MRPALLNQLFLPLGSLKGIGPRLVKLLEKLTGPYVAGLLWHVPQSVIDRRTVTTVAGAVVGEIATLRLTVRQHYPPRLKKLPYRVKCDDATGALVLGFFHVKGDWVAETLPVGAEIAVSGKVEDFQGIKQILHPDYVVPAARISEIAILEPVYALTAGLSTKLLRRYAQQALGRLPTMPEWQDMAWRAKNGWLSFRDSLLALHNPQRASDLWDKSPFRARLAYDELLAGQLALALIRGRTRAENGRSFPRADGLRAQIADKLPFSLTAAQRQALVEIDADMALPLRMLRLLQGDVGSGKTLVALFAMLNAVAAGTQAVLMVPTEILAQQHLATLAPLLEGTGVRAIILTGRSRSGRAHERKKVLQLIETGYAKIIIGTHALFQEDVAFNDLGLVVIDEQHRFGVHQRLRLAQKGAGVDTLVMTATPIPRTLALTAYGDLEVSRLTGKPPGRKPVATKAIALDRLDEVVEAVGRKIWAGERVYWVCPLVEVSEDIDLAAAEERHSFLEKRLGIPVGLVHGRMKSTDKDRVMAAFASGQLQVLVATTVIEVGVNVPEATVMVVEHAERFGLAQLHQLRGRVGRGERPSSCLLLYLAPLGQTARARLAMMRDTDDGFRIAEEDLRLRGAGEMLGTRQSGLPVFHMADLAKHEELLMAARDDAKIILNADPELTGPRGQALRLLLYLFERDQAVRYLRSG